MTASESPVRVHMTGSEWFGSAPGGLNRYFTDLHGALAARPDVVVSSAAFGTAPEGGGSWVRSADRPCDVPAPPTSTARARVR